MSFYIQHMAITASMMLFIHQVQPVKRNHNIFAFEFSRKSRINILKNVSVKIHVRHNNLPYVRHNLSYVLPKFDFLENHEERFA